MMYFSNFVSLSLTLAVNLAIISPIKHEYHINLVC